MVNLNGILLAIGIIISLLGISCGFSVRYFPVMEREKQIPVHGAISIVGIAVIILSVFL